MTFEERVKAGLDGKFKGLSNGLNRINSVIFGVQRSCYTLIGGASGSCKTSFEDYVLLQAIQDATGKGITINVKYYCLEISEHSKKATWLSMLIYEKYGIEVKREAINGFGDFRLTEAEQKLCNDVLPELDVIWNSIDWTFTAVNPTGVYKDAWEFMSKRGTFIYDGTYVDDKGNEKQKIEKFVPNDPEEYNVIVADHIALFSYERGFTLKENLDKLSEYAVTLRNLFGYSIHFIQQFNQGLSSVDRQKFKGVDLSPQQSDFKDSTSPYQDCDIALGLMNANKMGMEECMGYNINKTNQYPLGGCFRMLKVIKNRLSIDDVTIGLAFLGKSGRFEELPPVKKMTIEDYKKYYEMTNS
jgi:hypothetical protein